MTKPLPLQSRNFEASSNINHEVESALLAERWHRVDALLKMPEMINVFAPDIGSQCSWWRISKWVAADGDNVTPGQTIAELENDEMTCELESFDSGVIRRTVEVGTRVQVGGKIAELSFSKEEQEARLDHNFPLTVTLTGRDLRTLDSYRGAQSRESIASRLVVHALKQIGEQGAGGKRE